jgi:hypothetical protein
VLHLVVPNAMGFSFELPVETQGRRKELQFIFVSYAMKIKPPKMPFKKQN